MRTLRLSLTGTLILALLGGLAWVAVAQEEAADPTAPAAVTATMVAATDVSYGTTTREAMFERVEGLQVMDTYEASDPRLSGEMTKMGDMHSYPQIPGAVWAQSVVLDNEDGRWVGTADGFWGESIGCAVAMTMHGEGAYEGLTAYLIEDCGPDPVTFAGVILPGEMPQRPEPAA